MAKDSANVTDVVGDDFEVVDLKFVLVDTIEAVNGSLHCDPAIAGSSAKYSKSKNIINTFISGNLLTALDRRTHA